MSQWTVRLAKAADQDRIVEMGMRFLSSTQYGVIIRGVTMETMHGFVQLVREQVGAIFVVEGDGPRGIIGMLAVAVTVNPMSMLEEAVELAWWVEPEHRGGRASHALLVAAEQWATSKRLGCLKMIEPADSLQTGAFYEKLGYIKVETVYQKFLNLDRTAGVRGNGGGDMARH